jgi:hypothetical protein
MANYCRAVTKSLRGTPIKVDNLFLEGGTQVAKNYLITNSAGALVVKEN